ncbi:MAG: DUF4380 domain-containing protein [Deltaproteobacteria bacterium]|nr:DUF4380 domain-containing protein [Deltaproteobacteria bacterium]
MAGAGNVALRAIQHRGWDAWELSRDEVRLLLVPQVGGRIMGLEWRDQSLFFVHPELEGRVENLAGVTDVRAKKKSMGFLYWGGDKTWLAPQSAWTDDAPFLDLDSGAYEFDVDEATPSQLRVTMTSPICRESGAQIIRTIELGSRDWHWTVTHTLRNRSSGNIRWGLWNVSMVMKPARVYLPRAAVSAYPQGIKTFTEEGESAAIRDRVVHPLGTCASIDCVEPRKYKFGVDASEGWILSVIELSHRILAGYLKKFPVFQGAKYAHGCTAEVFCSGEFDYFELEIHGPLVTLEPGQSFSFAEDQCVFDITDRPGTEQELRKLLEKRNYPSP